MPRLSKSVPRYCKHRASGQAVVTLNGKDIYLGRYGSRVSRMEYDRLIAEWLAHGRRLPDEEDQEPLSVAEMALAYWKHAQRYYVKDGRPTGEVGAYRVVLRDLRRLFGRTRASDFGPSRLRALRQKWIDRDLARTTINQHTNRTVRMFRWAVAHEMIEPSVVHALGAVDGLRKGRSAVREPDAVKPVDEATIETTLEQLPRVVADMVRFQRLTSCRPGELFILRSCDIDRGGDIWTYRPASHKTQHHDHSRLVHIGPKAQAILRPYLLRGAEEYCFSPVDSERQRLRDRHEKRVTPSSSGNTPGSNRSRDPVRRPGARYTSDSFRRAIHRACKKANVAPWSPNQLRHAAATEIRKRYGLEGAQVVLGHARANVTQVYAEADRTLAARIAEEIG